ncbi:hypothetical protein LRB91_18500, partial [Leclercia adecarboxylata]|uniref:hypothetical protein n=1 Tax=Leclercia adecarboxylata TaxID=83655 RepID=UPI0022B7CCD0
QSPSNLQHPNYYGNVMKVKEFKTLAYYSWILNNCNKVYANDSTDKFAHITQNKKMAKKGKTSTIS